MEEWMYRVAMSVAKRIMQLYESGCVYLEEMLFLYL
jgi:hypothetical protein